MDGDNEWQGGFPACPAARRPAVLIPQPGRFLTTPASRPLTAPTSRVLPTPANEGLPATQKVETPRAAKIREVLRVQPDFERSRLAEEVMKQVYEQLLPTARIAAERPPGEPGSGSAVPLRQSCVG